MTHGSAADFGVWPVTCLFLSRREFIIPHEQKLVFADFVSATLLIASHRLAGDGIDKLLAKAISRLLINLPEGYALFFGDGGVQGNRAGNEREL
jgi:hypothetical protein